MWFYIVAAVVVVLGARWYYFARRCYPALETTVRKMVELKRAGLEEQADEVREAGVAQIGDTLRATKRVPWIDGCLAAFALVWCLYHVRRRMLQDCTCPDCRGSMEEDE